MWVCTASAGLRASSPPMALMPTVGSGVVVSSVKFNVLAALTLPAASVWRTLTVLAPSAAVKVVVHVVPLVLYSTVEPVSRLLTAIVPSRLILSLLLAPLSHSRATVLVPTVLSITRGSVCAALVLPAGSVAMMLTLPLVIAMVGVTLQLPSAATVVLSTSLVPGMVT